MGHPVALEYGRIMLISQVVGVDGITASGGRGRRAGETGETTGEMVHRARHDARHCRKLLLTL
jgi:hypothetical protein